ncbi:MAG TPA: HD domain-containing protein [Acidimicrobiia bacterium]|nr:HD domain-containing protein [Acidimicrobiia bacterium]
MIESERARRWASTMEGHTTVADIRLAHAGAGVATGPVEPLGRAEREAAEAVLLAPGATRAEGAGTRARPEEPDPLRTCFERDRDRILHSTAFRRLAGKTQVFVFPDDHQRTRLTHALEVAQVATAVARATRLNVALTEAIALGHDCGHGPGGHASEEALSPYLAGGYDHAVWGADVVLEPLNLCAETLDGIRNHSWSRPAPRTPEGAVVSWADRCAYTAHDLEDAVRAGVVSLSMLPSVVVERLGERRGSQLRAFIAGLVEGITATGQVGMRADLAEALAALRAFNYEHIYLRPASVAQADAVVGVLQPLVDYFADRPNAIGGDLGLAAGSPEAVRAAVTYVAGMTDRFAFQSAVAHLGWDPARLPAGIDTASLRRSGA